jgi:hypothetical protein
MVHSVDVPDNLSSFRAFVCPTSSLVVVSLFRRFISCPMIPATFHRSRTFAASNCLSSVLLRVHVSLPYIRHDSAMIS